MLIIIYNYYTIKDYIIQLYYYILYNSYDIFYIIYHLKENILQILNYIKRISAKKYKNLKFKQNIKR